MLKDFSASGILTNFAELRGICPLHISDALWAPAALAVGVPFCGSGTI